MFCLFRNSRIIAPYNFWVNFISLSPVLYWLHFALIEKQFLDNFFSGQTLFVDLLLGLPVVLVFAIVIYAMIFWVLKLAIVMAVPSWVVKLEPLTPEEDELIDDVFDPAVDDIGIDPKDSENTPNNTNHRQDNKESK